jgi:tetratricopeptide (TPR) repeat protein
MVWYFKACEFDHEYKTAHVNVSDVFDELNFTDEQIYEEMTKYPKLDPFMFYYYLGLAYYDKKKVDTSIKWYFKANELNSNSYKLFNSLGISYDEKRDYPNGEKYYVKCI